MAWSRTSTGKPGGHDRQEVNEPMAESRVDGSASRADYFAHEADVGVIGRGATLVDAFAAAAEATFAIMAPLAAVRPAVTPHFCFDEADPELALVTWLNRLIGEAQAAGLMLGAFQIHCEGDQWVGEASGEPWRAGLEPGVEVKGATLTMLAVRQSGNPDPHPLAPGSGRRGARSLQGREPGGRGHRESRSGAASRLFASEGLRQRIKRRNTYLAFTFGNTTCNETRASLKEELGKQRATVGLRDQFLWH